MPNKITALLQAPLDSKCEARGIAADQDLSQEGGRLPAGPAQPPGTPRAPGWRSYAQVAVCPHLHPSHLRSGPLERVGIRVRETEGRGGSRAEPQPRL